jgi:hypothetical protein
MGTAENPHAGQGMVVLDIGGDIGALVVSAPDAMSHVEIEICPSGARNSRPDDGGDWWQGEWHAHADSAAHDQGHHDHGDHDHGHHDHGGGSAGSSAAHSHPDRSVPNRHSSDNGPGADPKVVAWPHVAVISRPTGTGREHSAVFPGLRAGDYDLWLRPDEPTALTVTVRGAQVTTVAWPT